MGTRRIMREWCGMHVWIPRGIVGKRNHVDDQNDTRKWNLRPFRAKIVKFAQEFRENRKLAGRPGRVSELAAHRSVNST